MNFNWRIVLCIFLSATIFQACSSDELPDPEPMVEPNPVNGIIWDGPLVDFSKSNGADPAQEENQDRITDNAWITRGNNGGQIFNAAVESAAIKNSSPRGTQWAQGTLDQIEELNFRDFRSAVGKPQNVVGKDLVMYIEEDNIYLSVKFTGWSQRRGGGFSYTRSTPK